MPTSQRPCGPCFSVSICSGDIGRGQIHPSDDAGDEICLFRRLQEPARLAEIVERLDEHRAGDALRLQCRAQIGRVRSGG